MPHYKLTYFNFRGRAELLRYLFAYMNTEYEDCRIEYDDWPEHKSSYPFGKLPALEIDGTIYYQSLAIGRYLARKAGLRGKTELDDLHIDAISDTIDDFVSLFPWYTDDKIEMKKYLDKNGPTVLSGIEKELGDKNWFAGDYVTWADFFWDICSDSIDFYVPDFAKDYPKLVALRKRVQEVPEIAEWIKRRPQTPY
ncbi:PREDICTED: hematopoietic prostaglandin D synthase-like [Nanorana parkeri]|uniref:hematopoietic prostaglandin D synthase-like n=1 Tax=Nanorana parkeri TaxID=125878 RepID=UPI0008546124|nr:PREDICTED: hematopoietic prostaglandin D synthase-like [Nanorana parkeri]